MSADDVIAELFGRFEKIKGRRGQNPRGGAGKREPVSKTGGRVMLERMARRAPETMVKITASSRNARQARAHMLYITRKGTLPLEDERGDIHFGREGVGDVARSWQHSGVGMPLDGDRRREAFHVMFGMPVGTDRPTVTAAVRAFVAEEFQGHEYAFTAHDDRSHPHVHVIVKTAGHDGVRLNPRKADLHRWRVGFADALTERGVEAAATPRAARGKVHKAEKMAVRQINDAYRRGDREAPARVTIAAEQAAEHEVDTGQPKTNPAARQIESTRREVIAGYERTATALAQGDHGDRRLALDLVSLVRSMPSTATQHDERVKEIRDERSRSRAPERGRER